MMVTCLIMMDVIENVGSSGDGAAEFMGRLKIRAIVLLSWKFHFAGMELLTERKLVMMDDSL